MPQAVVAAFAFGMSNTSLPNLHIALFAAHAARELGAVIFTQGGEYLDFGELPVQRVDEEPNKPAPTLRIARGAVKLAKTNGTKDIYLVCAPSHKPRCIRDLQAASREAEIKINIHVVDMSQHDAWFLSNAGQLHTRFKLVWHVREMILMRMPFSLYERVAG